MIQPTVNKRIRKCSLPPRFEEKCAVRYGESYLSEPELHTARDHCRLEVTRDQLKTTNQKQLKQAFQNAVLRHVHVDFCSEAIRLIPLYYSSPWPVLIPHEKCLFLQELFFSLSIFTEYLVITINSVNDNPVAKFAFLLQLTIELVDELVECHPKCPISGNGGKGN